MHLAENLLKALDTGDRERLLVCSRETLTALRKPMRTTLEKELAELLSSVAGELVSILAAGQTEDSSADRLLLYRDLVSHVKEMAHQEQ